MKLNKNDLLLYAVTDRRWLKNQTLYQQVEQTLKGGTTMVQIREKNLDHESFLQEAKQIQVLCKQYQVPLIINDDVQLAKEIDADGVHIGQDDLDLKKARDILGPDKIIGVSAHDLNEAKMAYDGGADYLGVGAIFTTATKDDADAVSLKTLKEICQQIDIPVVAIGGINEHNILSLTGSGIDGVAIVSAIFASDDIQGSSEILKQKTQRIVHPQIHSALTIAGSDSSGGAGIQADLKTMLAHHVYGMSAITALTAQNTAGVAGILDVTPDFLALQLDSIFQDIYPEAVKIGMVSKGSLIKVIADKLHQYPVYNIVIDPVMVATSGAKLLNDDAINVLKDYLFSLATVLTPNIPEAMILSDIEIKNEEDMKKAAQIMSEKYQCAILVKGGHQINDANDLLYDGHHFTWFKGKKIDNQNTHGTGCTLSSAIASNLAKGDNLHDAIKKAKDYISGCLQENLDLGSGQGPMDHGCKLK